MSFDRTAIARDFGHAASRYDAHAHLQQQVLERLLAYAQPLLPPERRVLDVGCGTGRLAEYLPQHQIIGVDLAHSMARMAQRRGECALAADMACLPFVADAFERIVCSLALQWAEDPRLVLEECGRVLAPGGVVALTTLGPATLQELRQAFAAVDGAVHVSPFSPIEALLSTVNEAGLQMIQAEVEMIREHYAYPKEVMQQLKAIGAGNKHTARRRGLLTPRRMEQVYAAYEEGTAQEEGVSASWEVYYLVLRKEPLP